MSKRFRKNKRNQGNPRNNNKKDKKVEINVNDSNVNTADLGPMEGKPGSKKSDNDYTWYNNYPELLRNVSGINFGEPLGSDVDEGFGTWQGKTPNLPASQQNIPGICTIHYVPTFGQATGIMYRSPINKVAVQLYSAMRVKLGSTASYDPTDVTMYLIAMDSAYQLYALGAKIYGCLRMSSPFNYYFMQGLVESLGVDYTSFSTNLAQFRSFINQYAIYLSSYLVPSDFSLFKRHMWHMQNIFTDNATPKGQMYQFMLDGFYVWTEVTEGPAYCKFSQFSLEDVGGEGKITFNTFMDACNQVLTALQTSQDIAQMSADIGKAFEQSVYQLALIPEEFITNIAYSKEVLSQIENMRLYGPVFTSKTSANSSYNNWDIVQNVSLTTTPGPALLQVMRTQPSQLNKASAGPAMMFAYAAYLTKRALINKHFSEVSNEMNMVMTRGVGVVTACGMDEVDDTQWYIELGSVGTEVYTFADIVQFNATGFGFSHNPYITMMGSGLNLQTIAQWSTFDWAPMLYQTAASGNTYRYLDVDMYALIDNDQIEMMNTTAILSELYSPKFPQSKLNG